MNFLIFPNQLFDTKYLPKEDISHCYLLEDPLYFGHRETMMNFNKLKLILHCASMRHYEKRIKRQWIFCQICILSRTKRLDV